MDPGITKRMPLDAGSRVRAMVAPGPNGVVEPRLAASHDQRPTLPLRAVSVGDAVGSQQIAVGARDDERPLARRAGEGEAHDDVFPSAVRRIDAKVELLECEEVVRDVSSVQARQSGQGPDAFARLAHEIHTRAVIVAPHPLAPPAPPPTLP